MEKGTCLVETKARLAGRRPARSALKAAASAFQIGASETDLVLLVMNQGGADKLLASKFTLGVEGSIAAGPVGRTATAQTDAQMHAEILSWSRSQGLFAGLALEGATLRQDLDDNAELYGKPLDTPIAAAKLIAELDKYPVREHTSAVAGSSN